jgi:hypothetical protein
MTELSELATLRLIALGKAEEYWGEDANLGQIREAAGFYETFLLLGYDGTEEWASKPESAPVLSVVR